MNNQAIVAGVGMVPFGKPGASDPYDVMAGAAVRWRWRTPASLTTWCSRRSSATSTAIDFRPARALPRRHDRHPDRQRQQQLLDRIDRAVPGPPGGRGRRGGLRPGARVRADAAGRAERALDRPPVAVRRFDELCDEICPYPVPIALRYFGGAGEEYMESYGAGPELFAQVRAKASRHAADNPLALFRKVVTEEEVLASPMIFPEAGMTRLMAARRPAARRRRSSSRAASPSGRISTAASSSPRRR